MKLVTFFIASFSFVSLSMASLPTTSQCNPELQALNLVVEMVAVDYEGGGSCTLEFSAPTDRTVKFMANPSMICPLGVSELLNKTYEMELSSCPKLNGKKVYFSGVVVKESGVSWISELDGSFSEVQ